MNLFESIISALLPDRCAYCGKVVSSNRRVCRKCENELPRIEGTVCRKCGREKDRCSCKGSEKYFTSLIAPFYFEGCVRTGLHIFKFRKGYLNYKVYSEEIAEVIKERYSDVDFDFVTEVPMTVKSQKQRGYNQCYWLAKGIGENLGIEHKPNALVKLYDTQKQHGISYHLRKGNLTGVFDVENPEDIKGKRILVCDDISTSGETLNECAKMLWLYGAEEVRCVSVALTLFKSKKHIH